MRDYSMFFNPAFPFLFSQPSSLCEMEGTLPALTKKETWEFSELWEKKLMKEDKFIKEEEEMLILHLYILKIVPSLNGPPDE